MNFELNKEYNLKLIRVPVPSNSGDMPTGKATLKRVKIVAFPCANEMVVELVGARRYYQGVALPVRGRLHISDGIPQYMLTDQAKYEVKNVI